MARQKNPRPEPGQPPAHPLQIGTPCTAFIGRAAGDLRLRFGLNVGRGVPDRATLVRDPDAPRGVVWLWRWAKNQRGRTIALPPEPHPLQPEQPNSQTANHEGRQKPPT